MKLHINGFPINKKILLIDENHKSHMVVLGCRNNCDLFVEQFYGDINECENSEYVAWCYPPDDGLVDKLIDPDNKISNIL